MSYYILTNLIEDDSEDAILDGRCPFLERIPYLFNEGQSLAKEKIPQPIEFLLDINTLRGKMTDHLSIDGIEGVVFSSNVVDLLKKIQMENIEYFSLSIVDNFSNADSVALAKLRGSSIDYKIKKYENYLIANIANKVDCVNHQKSKLEYFYPDEIKEQAKEFNTDKTINFNDIDLITSLVLDETKIPTDMKIFRLYDQPNILVFHEDIVKAIKKEGLSGFVFVPLEKYTEVLSDEEEEENQA